MKFEWDERKAYENLRKHDASFDEAVAVFLDPLSMTLSDEDHSIGEHRYIDLGLTRKGRLLVVVYTERGERIRIISCRTATAAERKTYETARS